MRKIRRESVSWIGALLACLIFVFMPYLDAYSKTEQATPAIQISHTPMKFFVPGFRIIVKALVTDEPGIMLVRCYFRAKGEADFIFVDMPLVAGDEYKGVLPAPSANTSAIEYLLLAVNNNKVVVKSQRFTVYREEGYSRPEWQSSDLSSEITVKTELAQAPQTIPGFSDNIVADAVESAVRFGYVVDGIYILSQMAGTAPAGAVSGGTITASTTNVAAAVVTGTVAGGGGSALGTIAIVTGGAAALAGGALALGVFSSDDDGSDLPGGTGEVKVTLQWSNCADLDLHVTDPCGNTINFMNKSANCSGKTGTLDIDQNAGSLNCSNPAENIYWSTAPNGTYTVKVKYYASNSGSGTTSYTVTTIVGGNRRTYSGSLSSAGNINTVTTFSF